MNLINQVLAGARAVKEEATRKRELAGGRPWSPEAVYRCNHKRSVVTMDGQRICLSCRVVGI